MPSITELLYDLGLDHEVAGITKFCVHPGEWYRNKPRIGGTKNPNIEAIRALQPTLVIANKEENRREDVEALQAFTNVWVTDVSTLTDALTLISEAGQRLHQKENAASLYERIQKGFESLPSVPAIPVAYLIWQQPYMSCLLYTSPSPRD